MARKKTRAIRPAQPSSSAPQAPPEKKREYIYSFELMRPFSSVRAFIFKKQLSKSMVDTFMELFGSPRRKARE